jgi:hypothetical protein
MSTNTTTGCYIYVDMKSQGLTGHLLVINIGHLSIFNGNFGKKNSGDGGEISTGEGVCKNIFIQ